MAGSFVHASHQLSGAHAPTSGGSRPSYRFRFGWCAEGCCLMYLCWFVFLLRMSILNVRTRRKARMDKKIASLSLLERFSRDSRTIPEARPQGLSLFRKGCNAIFQPWWILTNGKQSAIRVPSRWNNCDGKQQASYRAADAFKRDGKLCAQSESVRRCK